MFNLVYMYSLALTKTFNDFVKREGFPNIWKYIDITTVFTKGNTIVKVTIDLLVPFQFLKNL